MADEKILHVDDDWKVQAQREKERLAQSDSAAPQPMADASFASLVELLAMQVFISIGGLAGPGGERLPPNPEAAKHFIDLLGVLESKTRNNLTPEEKALLDNVLYEVRMRYVQAGAGPGM
ncbi:MAG: hypothetical protein CHACPFDD_04092 [Phycisphaerae bacterium]|nr:hypothetical protein [Phycisphaerae bacterium]